MTFCDTPFRTVHLLLLSHIRTKSSPASHSVLPCPGFAEDVALSPWVRHSSRVLVCTWPEPELIRRSTAWADIFCWIYQLCVPRQHHQFADCHFEVRGLLRNLYEVINLRPMYQEYEHSRQQTCPLPSCFSKRQLRHLLVLLASQWHPSDHGR